MGTMPILEPSSCSPGLSDPRGYGEPSRLAAQEPGRRYVLMTAAYNEEVTIEQTITSVLSQTLLPSRWVIASDGSFDKTDMIVRSYAEKYDFIRFLRITRSPGRSFNSKVLALRSAFELTSDVAFDLIGNIDADVSVNPSYFADLVAKFSMNPKLGLAAGFVFEKKGQDYRQIASNRAHSVVHAAQLLRRECYQAIGGYAVLKFGGEDWHAETSVRMMGWEVEAFPNLQIFHHRPTGEAERLLRYKFRAGRMDYSLGSDPLFEAVKCLVRVLEKPIIIGALARWAGFTWSWMCGDRRPVSRRFMAFLRKCQRERLRLLLAKRYVRVEHQEAKNQKGIQWLGRPDGSE
jgi:poly-beta-1,6-N-acetyl-D-glucosamine synthase